MDFTEITTIGGSLPQRLRRSLALRGGPPSLRAQLALLASAFLLGGVVAGLLFVGVWRHTSAQGDDARAAQLAAAQRLQLVQTKLTQVQTDLAETKRDAASTRRALRTARGEAAVLRRRTTRTAAAIRAPLADVTTNAAALTRRAAKLRAALATMTSYLQSASATGVDPAFLEAQLRYVSTSTDAAAQTAAALAHGATQAEQAAAQLRRP